MPELPEVETVIRGLRPRLEGRRLEAVQQRRKDLRFPLPKRFAARLTGRRVERIERRAKYILVHLDGGEALLAHLGMSGRMVLVEDAAIPLERHDHIVFETDEGVQIRFNDTRRFGIMDLVPEAELDAHWLLKELGPEPLSNAFNGPFLAARLAGRRTPIKSALLDQKIVAGLGNIYTSEALFFAGLSPRRQAYTVAARPRRAPGLGNPRRPAAGDRRRRLLLARLCPGRRRARLFPASVGGLRPGRRGLPRLRLRRAAEARHPPPGPIEPRDFLLSKPPALR